MMTYGEFRALRASDTVGICSNKATFLAMTNEAVSRLLTRGGFWGTITKLRACVRCQAIVWPRIVDTVLATNVCGRQIVNSGYFWEFLPMNGADWNAMRSIGMFGVGGIGGAGGGIGFGAGCGNVVIQHDGQVPVQAQLKCGAARYVRAFPAYQADVGKTVTLFGIDDNGQEIFTKRADGTYLPGVVLTLDVPFVGTSFLVREVARVLKDATQGPVRLYAYDPVADVMEDMAYYQPSERSPSFLHSTVRGLRQGCRGTASCNGLTSITALIKMRFVPIETDDDVVQIDNWTALKLMLLAIRAEDAGDTDEALKLQARSVHELNLELRSHLPESEIPIAIEPFGTATPRSIGVGCIV